MTAGYISKSKRFYNAKPSAYYYYEKIELSVKFHICITVPLKISRNSQEKTCVRVYFLIKVQTSDLQLY